MSDRREVALAEAAQAVVDAEELRQSVEDDLQQTEKECDSRLTYQQIQSVLGSEEAVELIARAIHYHPTQGCEDWAEVGGERRAYVLEHARRSLADLATQLFGEGTGEAANRARDALRVQAGKARVLMEEGKFGEAHEILEQIRYDEEVERAEIEDRQDAASQPSEAPEQEGER